MGSGALPRYLLLAQLRVDEAGGQGSRRTRCPPWREHHCLSRRDWAVFCAHPLLASAK